MDGAGLLECHRRSPFPLENVCICSLLFRYLLITKLVGTGRCTEAGADPGYAEAFGGLDAPNEERSTPRFLTTLLEGVLLLDRPALISLI